MKNEPNLEKMTKAQLLEVLNDQFKKECKLWKDISEWTSKSNRLETQVLELNCSVQSREQTIKELRETTTRLELENMRLTADIEGAAHSVKRLRSTRSELRDDIKALEDKVTSLNKALNYRADLHDKDNAHSREVYAELERELRKWKALCAKEILENCDE